MTVHTENYGVIDMAEVLKDINAFRAEFDVGPPLRKLAPGRAQTGWSSCLLGENLGHHGGAAQDAVRRSWTLRRTEQAFEARQLPSKFYR